MLTRNTRLHLVNMLMSTETKTTFGILTGINTED